MSAKQAEAVGKLDSWREVIQFYEELTSYPHWQHVVPLHELAGELMQSERGSRFRAGTSVAALIITTADHHGLEPGEPFVRVESTGWGDDPRYEVSCCDGTAGEPLEQTECDINGLRRAVESMMDRLWQDG